MNKTAIRNFSIWARNKLIADIEYRAGLMGIASDGINDALPQSTRETQFFDIGTAEPYTITGEAIKQRASLVNAINQKANETDYATAYKYIIEGVAYTWFNRLIAVRFMEVNDYLPSHIRVLSSESGKMEPDLVTNPFDAELPFTDDEKQEIIRLKNDNELDECFRMLFIKQCNALNEILPALFEKTSDYTEVLLNISAIDKEGVVYHLVNDIPEEDFNIEMGGQVEIIGWMYQYYNTEPKNEAFAKNGKISKEEIPAVTQLFTPDWIVRYMVENSLGRIWVEGHPNDYLKAGWKYYLEDAEQEPDVQEKLDEIHAEYAKLNPEDIHFIDPCMGSGHILVYAFDVLMQIYESAGYSQRDAAKSILENNLYGLDIDDRAYQMAYFAVMMKARQYNRRILSAETPCHVYSIQDSNSINRNQLKYFGADLNEIEKNDAMNQITGLLDTFRDAKEYGSILDVEKYNWELLRTFARTNNVDGQISLETIGIDETQDRLLELIAIGEAMARKYEVVVTNPPYMSNKGMNPLLTRYVNSYYNDEKMDMFAVFMTKCFKYSKKSSYISMITQHSWMFLSAFEKLRHRFLQNDIISLNHLGARAFEEISGEVVQTVSFVISNRNIGDYKGTYIRLVESNSQQLKELEFANRDHRYTARQMDFKAVPGEPVAYWISDNFRKIFGEKLIYEFSISDGQNVTSNNTKFVRNIWEVSAETIGKNNKWRLYAKGGGYRKWYGNLQDLVDWSPTAISFYHSEPSARVLPEYLWYRKGITWSLITTTIPSFRVLPEEATFDKGGSSIFIKDENDYEYILGLLNSKVYCVVSNMLNPTLNFQVKDIRNMPLIISKKEEVELLVKKNIELARDDWKCVETAWDYKIHPLLKGETMGRLISDKYKEWEAECDNRFNQLKANEEELNRIFIDIYGLQDELTPEEEDKDVTVRKADLQRDIKSLLSYAVGCMFGRYSLDVEGLVYAGGEWDASKYKTFIPDADNILPITDEEYFEDDIVGLLVEWLKKVYGEDTLEQNLDFIAQALGNKGNSSREIIRNYFVSDFFKDHCQTYSVTGSGKRPIYWLFDSGKQNGFKALIYLHRYNADTIGNLRVDYLHRMQRVYESEIGRMQDMIDHSTNSREVGAAAKRKEKLQKQLKECRDYDEKIGHLALARIELELDDGVKYNYRKVQTGADGKLYEVLADNKAIMMDIKKYKEFK
ncbi:Methyltransferase domain-containing protein [Butyrivibrio fibrisolvens DSM 3071]|uniref:site-specific DNA-methyltransferase (adenine-specific) n=1 Tax=Butyrivibrio fibrisolvens DSM 3071 TaxID=1121131 RepID=A0A1M5WZ32_BUTFI|nr:BREX-1 system adenine-specific DNA-methyltransferase PglX [Butyrivibrio fibrisolvens]SHH92879.1 Methyltransferase domain-containing protein [Butyrivibrio fibrisolvens DSM 3071]